LNLSQRDIDLLAKLVTAESDGEPFEGQVAVAATILNRLQDPLYPKTIPGIIYQVDNGRYQYSPVLDGRINQAASASAYRAVLLACSGWDPSNGANGFYNPTKTTNQWVTSQPVTVTIGRHIFFN
jgi:N-acetylmuramoyl-L-alanine amidase